MTYLFKHNRFAIKALTIITSCLLFAPCALSANDAEEMLVQPAIDNFEKVSPTIWRGAAPSDDAIRQLSKLGVKTLVDLRNYGPKVNHEKHFADTLGIKYVHIALGFGKPSREAVVAFLKIVTSPENQPVFIHCRQGADRTGTLIGIYRIIVEHWSYETTYVEMRLHHFKPWLMPMRRTISLLARSTHAQDILREMANLGTTPLEPLRALGSARSAEPVASVESTGSAESAVSQTPSPAAQLVSVTSLDN